MTFLNGWWALAGLLAVPVVLLYLLKMRRRPVTVSSTLLWRQTLTDLRANTPFQKLRRNLLLILQLLALAVLVAALCRPVYRTTGQAGSDIVVVVDASASMQATDAPEGRTRFEHAIDRAGELVDNLRGADRMMLIIAAPPGEGERTPLTNGKGELHGVLRRARCYDAAAAVDEALRLAASSLAATAEARGQGRVYLLSDGVGVTLPDARGLDDALQYVRIGVGGANVGVTSLSVADGDDGRRRVLTGVSNAGAAEASVLVSYYFGSPDNWIDTKKLTIAPGEQRSAVLDAALPPGRLWVKLETDDDLLALDNTGYVILPEPRKLTVRLVTVGNPVLTRYLAAGQNLGWFTAEGSEPKTYTADTPVDVTIFDSFVPPDGRLPDGDVVLINPPTDAAGFRRIGTMAAPEMVNAATEADVLRFVNLAELKVAVAGHYTHDGGAVELIAAAGGPLLAYTTEGAFRRYLLAFHLADSSWATDPGFLILLSNILDRARTAHYVGGAQLIPAGGVARLPAGRGPANVVDPAGRTHRVDEGESEFAGTTTVGFYTADRDDASTEFAVNLLSATESDITPRVLSSSGGAEIVGKANVTPVNRPLWPLLAGIALAALMVEWYCYHRRVGQ